MERHSRVLKIMATYNGGTLNEFITAARSLGFLDEQNRPTPLGIEKGMYQIDYSRPQQISNFGDRFETYICFHNERPITAHIRIADRTNYVDAESFAIVFNYKNAEELMMDSDFMLDVISMIKTDTGESLIERYNLDGREKEYFKIGLYLSWDKEFNKKH